MASLYTWLLLCSFLGSACTTDATLLSSDAELSLSEDARAARLSSLDAAAQQQLCRALDEWTLNLDEERTHHALCLLTSSLAGGLGTADDAADAVASCERAYDECVASDLQPQSEGDEQLQAQACKDQDFSQCDATVGEWLRCQQDATLGLLGAFDELTCETAQLRPAAGMPMDSPLAPPSCKALAARCPSQQPPEPPPSCAFALRTTGEVEAELDFTSDQCGHSQGTGTGRMGWDYWALFGPPEGAVFHNVAVDLPWGFGEHNERGASVGLVLWRADGAAAWETHACTADVTSEACEDDLENDGFRFHFANGSCSLPATPSKTIQGASGQLEILAFSGSSSCIAPW